MEANDRDLRILSIIDNVNSFVRESKFEFETYIKNKTIPLQERWSNFIAAPEFLKNTTAWVHYFKAFKDFEEGEFEREVLYEHSNRKECIEMASWDEWLLGIADGSTYESWENSKGVKFTRKHYDAWREEVLDGNIGFVNFDW